MIDVAAIAPVLPAVPLARAHLPTARSAEDPVPVVVKVVVDVNVTASDVVALVEGLVSLTVTVDPLTAVTTPEAALNDPAPVPPAPAGREPEPGVVEPPLPPAAEPPPGRAPKPLVQLPETGWEIVTEVAVTGPPKWLVADVEEDAVVGVPTAVIHDPTVTADAVDATVCWKVVADV